MGDQFNTVKDTGYSPFFNVNFYFPLSQ